jgi:hypothetical protein
MRATARFKAVDYQPGVPPRVITTPDEQDLANLLGDVRAAKQKADTVGCRCIGASISCRV